MALPSHTSTYTFTNATKLTESFVDLAYGKLTYYTMTTDLVNVDFGVFNPPINLDVSAISGPQQDILKARTILDAQITNTKNPIQTNLNPYSYGQQAATAGKICALAKQLGEGGDGNIVTLLASLTKSLEDWLNGLNDTNNQGFKLTYEPLWNGIIVPGNAYGNKFYNDHHFHYGYFLYAVWCVELFNDTFRSNPGYRKKINNLMCDVCNPEDGSSFSVKVRHKDFYAGHSWATGIVDTVNRQQESSGEAINCYYACYLLADLWVTKVVDVAKYTKIRDVAKVALKLELDSSRNYYQLLGENTRLGDFNKVAGIGIMQTLGKAYTLDWGMQPNTFNGRSLGLYGIQGIPITEISFSHITTEWSNTLNNPTKTLDLYRITTSLVIGLNNNSYTNLSVPTSGIAVAFNPQTDGGFWGNVGTELLAPNTSVTNQQIQIAWNNLRTKQGNDNNDLIKHFDSYSNTLYWLMRHNRFCGFGFFKPSIDSKCTKIIIGCCITILMCHLNGKRTDFIQIEISGTVCRGCYKSYSACRCKRKRFKQCFSKKIDLALYVKGDDALSLSEKALALVVKVKDLIVYSSLKMGLYYLSAGKLNIARVLAEKSNELVMKTIEEGCYCAYLKLFRPYKDFEMYFK